MTLNLRLKIFKINRLIFCIEIIYFKFKNGKEQILKIGKLLSPSSELFANYPLTWGHQDSILSSICRAQTPVYNLC